MLSPSGRAARHAGARTSRARRPGRRNAQKRSETPALWRGRGHSKDRRVSSSSDLAGEADVDAVDEQRAEGQRLRVVGIHGTAVSGRPQQLVSRIGGFGPHLGRPEVDAGAVRHRLGPLLEDTGQGAVDGEVVRDGGRCETDRLQRLLGDPCRDRQDRRSFMCGGGMFSKHSLNVEGRKEEDRHCFRAGKPPRLSSR